MTLWSDFLRRLMLGATLSAPAVVSGADDAVASQPPAEIGEQQPEQQVDRLPPAIRPAETPRG